VSREKAAVIVRDILGALLPIGGFFLALAGFWIIVFDAASGIALAVNFVGPTLLISGIVVFIAGSAMNITEARRIEQSYLLPSPPERSPAPVVSPPRVPMNFSCPSCGYENDEAGFFCVACNSPLWPSGKPTGPPPSRSVVMRKIGHVMMIRRVKRTFVLVILALVISAPLTTNLAAGYAAVSQSKLAIEFDFYPPYFYPPDSQTTGILLITWRIIDTPRAGATGGLATSNQTYNVMFNNVQRPTINCPNIPDYRRGCDTTVPNVNWTQLNGTTVTVRVTLVAYMFIYRQQITRSVSVLCDWRCTEPDGSPWFY